MAEQVHSHGGSQRIEAFADNQRQHDCPDQGHGGGGPEEQRKGKHGNT